MQIDSKLPDVGLSIFSVMSQLAGEQNALNLSQGFPNYDPAPALRERVAHHLAAGANQYAPMTGAPALRQRIVEKVKRLYGKELDLTKEITITAGATQALFTAITAFVRPGDEVILIEPAFDSYAPAIEVNGGTVVAYEMRAPDYRIDWNAVGALVTDRTRMILTNTPHNPTGTVLEAADMRALEGLLRGTDIILLSDEVYEHLIFDGRAHQSVLRYPSLYRQSLAVFSFGKTFHATGWKVGYAVGPPELMAEFRKVHQYNVFSVNHPVQLALADYLAQPAHYLGLPDFYQQKRDALVAALAPTPLVPLPCAGTYFQLYDYSAVSDLPDVEFADWLTRKYKVATIPVSVFYTDPKQDNVVRVCFAKDEKTLARAGELLSKL